MEPQKNFLVIGANGELGKRIATRLSALGIVSGTARTNETASSLPQNLGERLLLDLADPDSIETLGNYLVGKAAPIDGVIVAAGRVGFGSSQDTSAEHAARLMQVNHLGPADLISRLFPLLAQSSHNPFVISITGVVAEKPFPGMSAYVASKTAHSAWLKAFQLEARRAGIRVIDARPGHTETGLATRPLFGNAPNFPQGMNPDHVADVILRAAVGEYNELPSEVFG